jgi:hypothetical protein
VISEVVTEVTGVGATIPSVVRIRVPVIWISSSTSFWAAWLSDGFSKADVTASVNELNLKYLYFAGFMAFLP